MIGGMSPLGPTGGGAGLPFGGIPPEYAARIEKLLADEADVPVPPVAFSHAVPAEESFGLRSFVAPHRGAIGVAVALVALETLLGQLGPRLTGYGTQGDLDVTK